MTEVITHIDIQQRMAEGVLPGRLDENAVRRMWWAALDVLQDDVLLPIQSLKGIWLASPLPALYEPRLLNCLQGWVWAPDELESLHRLQGSFLPPGRVDSIKDQRKSKVSLFRRLPLQKDDGHDPLLILITPQVQIALALQGGPTRRHLIMRSDPETLSDLLRMLDIRLNHENPEQAQELRKSLAELGQLSSNTRLEKLFWPRLSERLAGMATSLTLQALPNPSDFVHPVQENSEEITLLEALTHEVRTPLATIRTLIRSILRRKDLPHVVVSRLEQIDVQCTEQIDRFGLIFNAAELQRQPIETSMLASTDLGNMLKILHPGWSQQLERRGLQLHLDITPDLPKVLSDAERLEPMLGGLIDRSSRDLAPGASISLSLRPAGLRLKLQILTLESDHGKRSSSVEFNSHLGPVLSWNPSTGSLQLSQAATQRLLASLGGWLTHRRDSGLTIFFPIAGASED